jgi:hypothetical protein
MMLSWVMLRAASGPGSASLRSLLMTLLVLCGTQYPLRQQNWKRGWIDHALLIQCLVVPASLLLTGGQGGLLDEIWHAVLSLELVVAAGLGAAPGPPAGREEEAPAPWGWQAALLLPTMAALCAELVLALLAPTLWWDWWPWLGLMPPVLMLGLGLQVINGIAQARVAAERQLVAMEQHLQERPRWSATTACWPSRSSSRSPSASASASPPTCTTTWAPSC